MTSGVVSGRPSTASSGALDGICASIGWAPLRSSLIESADFVLIDVGLLLDARGLGAFELVQIDGGFVPQQRAALALGFFQIRILLLQFFDELGCFRLIVIMVFAEYHGLFDNRVETGDILPCLGRNPAFWPHAKSHTPVHRF